MNVAEIQAKFDELRKAENYVALGEFFWAGFMEAVAEGNEAEETEESKLYHRLWNSLSHREMHKCEEVV